MKSRLNDVEQRVYDAMLYDACCYDDNGFCCFEDIDYRHLGLTLEQFERYLSQLCQKGYIQVVNGGYYSYQILNNQIEYDI